MNANTPHPEHLHHSEFAIIENENGMTVMMLEEGVSAAETAAKHKGVVIDPGPFKSFEDANDALTELMDPEGEIGKRSSGNWPAT